MIINNPILPGFYPDPSICAVGSDYYIVNSTFAYFPGIPIFHSKDLKHWEQIGHAMERKTQLPLAGCTHSAGLFAPTIRYHEGKYYVICTNVSGGGNYIVSADKPEGPWSEPSFLKWDQAPGIDPSLFFDEDGTCYYIGTRANPYGEKYYGDNYIWIQKLNLSTMEMEGEPFFVWNGAMKDVVWPEGPHLYKKDGYYYIMYAEGGTGPHHCVCVIRSKSIDGPYENNFCNPIISHRFLGKKYPIQYVGHSDMIMTVDGSWYMVMLAVRPKEGYTNIGRETFLTKVEWEDGWPVVNPGVGLLTDTLEVDLPEWNPEEDPESYTYREKLIHTQPGMDKEYDFVQMAQSNKSLGMEFVQLREPNDNMYQLDTESNALRIYPGTDKMTDCGNPSFLAIRQSHHKCRVEITMDYNNLKTGDEAGIVLLQNNLYQIRCAYCDGVVQVIMVQNGVSKIIAKKYYEEADRKEKKIVFWMKLEDNRAAFACNGETLIDDVDIHELSTEVAGGFVGCTIGMYSTTNKIQTDSYVDFLSFSYQGDK